MAIVPVSTQVREVATVRSVAPYTEVTGVKCPCCKQYSSVVVSRLKLLKPPLSRLLFRYYRCGICEVRFREPSFVAKSLAWTSSLMLVGGVLLAAWTAWSSI